MARAKPEFPPTPWDATALKEEYGPMIEIKPMDESYIHIVCLHDGPVDPAIAPTPAAMRPRRSGAKDKKKRTRRSIIKRT